MIPREQRRFDVWRRKRLTMEILDIISLFTEKSTVNYSIKDTSHGEEDFRQAVFVKLDPPNGQASELPCDLVIKLADNDFTTSERLEVMRQMTLEYRTLGYYCPRIFAALDGTFPDLDYQGRRCIAYAEEYSVYRSAEQFDETLIVGENGYYMFFDDAMLMNARVAAKQFDFTDLPSGYCLFQPFSPSDGVDEVMENAVEWHELAQTLPSRFDEQVGRIWTRYMQNRDELAAYYDQLPTSVFQADLNHTNILLNEQGEFAGIYDFNLCGKDVFLNYLMREVPYICYGKNAERPQKDPVLDSVLHAITVVKEIYPFSDLEKQAALPLWRCLKPLWWTSVQRLKEAMGDEERIRTELDKVEEMQTREIDFAEVMG